MLGETARRLKDVGSKSSSRRRLLLTLLVISAAVINDPAGGTIDRVGDDGGGCESWVSMLGKMKPVPEREDDIVDREGESIGKSSLIPEDDPLGKRPCGGGVLWRSSANVSQNFLPLELRMACCLKLLEMPRSVDGVDEESAMISSSWMSPSDSCVGTILGEEGPAAGAGGVLCLVGSISISLSRTCRTTSASRRTSVSIGALSSASAARILAKPLVLGYVLSVIILQY
jgi:hypothetical protein